MNILKVITPDNLGKGITFNPETKQWEVQSGFDCAALSALPSKPWKKGTTLLAKQDGGVHPINRVRFDFPGNRRRYRCR